MRDVTSAKVTNVSAHGLWLMTHGKELFLPYAKFPWFREATISAITDVREVRPGHFRWPALDIDLSIESIEDPEKYPLVAR